MPHHPSAFNRLLEPLDGREVRRIVARHGGDHGVGSGPRALTCVRQLRMLLFAQVTGLSSLRELCEGLLARPGSLYHMGLGVPRRSTLADAMAKRPVAVFRDICSALLPRVQRSVRRESDALITLLDATPVNIRDPRSDWAEADARTRGLKLHLGFEPRADALSWIDLTSPKISDVTAARAMPIEAGTTYVYDKGYLDFGWWHKVHAAGACFVSRLKTNTKRRDVHPRTGLLEPGILGDATLRIGHKAPRGGAANPLFDTVLREIVVERDGKTPLVLITNDLTRLKTALFAPLNLSNHAKPPPRRPGTTPIFPQLALDLSA